MAKGLRMKHFKLGCLHGKLIAEKQHSEAHIQRTVYLSQRLQLVRTYKDAPIIRIFGYEVPLENNMRGRCIDLLGYDKDFNIYLIELKKKDSTEDFDKINKQINDYATMLIELLPMIESEFYETYFFPIKFQAINKLLIAPREFYKARNMMDTDPTITYGYFKDKDINTRESKDIIRIHLKRY